MLVLASPSANIRSVFIGDFQDMSEAKKYPVAAVEHVEKNRYAGPLFNDFDWGGYLIWTLPEYPVSLDGRTNVYGDARLFIAFSTWTTPDGWKDDQDVALARLVIARADTPLVQSFRQLPDVSLPHHRSNPA